MRRSIELYIKVTGFYKFKKVMEQLSSEGYYRGLFRDYLSELLRKARDYAEAVTHVDTGALASAHRWEYDSHRMTGRLSIDRRIAYARGSTVQWPYFYGPHEEGRGGSHAFYSLTYQNVILADKAQGLKAQVQRTL